MKLKNWIALFLVLVQLILVVAWFYKNFDLLE